MKKILVLAMTGLLLGGVAFAQEEENGALGIGLLFEGQSPDGQGVGGNLRGTMFLDIGFKLVGPLYYGFELQGDVKKLSEENFEFDETDITYFDLGGGDGVLFYDTTTYNQTYIMWDLDFSPRGYISFDLGNKVQILGFAGLNFNWQTLDYEITANDVEIESGSVSSDTFVSLVMGFRVTVGAFYADYTRFLDDTSQQVSWNKYNKDRLGLGINLRF